MVDVRQSRRDAIRACRFDGDLGAFSLLVHGASGFRRLARALAIHQTFAALRPTAMPRGVVEDLIDAHDVSDGFSDAVFRADPVIASRVSKTLFKWRMFSLIDELRERMSPGSISYHYLVEPGDRVLGRLSRSLDVAAAELIGRAAAQSAAQTGTQTGAEGPVATVIGLRRRADGATVLSAEIERGRSTRAYWFEVDVDDGPREIGKAEDDLRPISRTARFSADFALGDLSFYSRDLDLAEDADGGRYLRAMPPITIDHNHSHGVGVFNLVFALGPHRTTSTVKVLSDGDEAGGPFEEFTDLRDATIEVDLTGRTFAPEQEAGIIVQSTYRAPSGETMRFGWYLPATERRASGGKQTLVFHLDQRDPAWEPQGSGFHGSVMDNRYRYGHDSLNNALRRNAQPMVLVHRSSCPEALFGIAGVGLSSVRMRLRNPSMLTAGTARLEHCRAAAATLAGLVTNGRSGDIDDLARSRVPGPATIRWRFDGLVRPSAIRLHQNPLYPTKGIRFVLADDAGRVVQRFDRLLPRGRQGEGENIVKTVYLAERLEVRTLEVHFFVPWGDQGMGLDLIEVLGDMAEHPSDLERSADLERSTVSAEFVTPGSGPLRARLVQREGETLQRGPWTEFQM